MKGHDFAGVSRSIIMKNKDVTITPITRYFRFARSIYGEDLLENFLISAVTAVLLVRLFLYLTGYPQLGGAGLHIAHLLWG